MFMFARFGAAMRFLSVIKEIGYFIEELIYVSDKIING